jgi:DNA-binding NarL/FixJ family response regulator
MTGKIQIIVVDDNPTFLEGIRTFLEKEMDYEIMAVFSSGIEFLDNIADFDPDLVLLDIEMPELNGIETARRLNHYGLELKLVAITMYHDQIYIKQLVEAGFRGFVNKNKVSEQLHQVISIVMNDGLAFPEMESL